MRLHKIMRLAKVAGPAMVTVETVIAMNIAAGQVRTTCPAPKRHSWTAWNAVIAAQISIAAKTLQAR